MVVCFGLKPFSYDLGEVLSDFRLLWFALEVGCVVSLAYFRSLFFCLLFEHWVWDVYVGILGCLCPGCGQGWLSLLCLGFRLVFYLVGLLVGLYVGIVIGLTILCPGCGLGFIWLVACWLRVIFVSG